MKTNRVRQNVLPLLTALIWGTAFVFQSMGADYLGPCTFNAARLGVAFLFLLALCTVLRLTRRRNGGGARESGTPPTYRRDLLLGGFCCGAALAAGSYLQQKGLETTTPGKAAFITALYIVLVPIIGLLLKKRAPRTIWIGVVLAVAGLYFLCMTGTFSVSGGDVYELLCAFCFAGHILVIDYFAQKVDGVEMSCVQFLAAAVLSGIGMLLTESPTWEAVRLCAVPILYVGIVSSGLGYTLQIVAQKGSDPTVVSLLLSLESVFSVIAGAIVLGDRMSGRESFGCVLMLAAVVLAQLPERKKEPALKDS